MSGGGAVAALAADQLERTGLSWAQHQADDQSVTEVHGHGMVFGPTKTYERRTSPLMPSSREEPGALLATRPTGPDTLVFTSPDGGPLRHRNFYDRHFKPAVREANLPASMRFHDLRHTCAAMCIALGAHPKAIQERLGHSSITVTLDRYGHLFPSLGEALTAGLEQLRLEALADFSQTSRGSGGSVALLRKPK